ncbi:MAG: GatB/YqeY domain-containing protein [Chitinophagaceae bacterium]
MGNLETLVMNDLKKAMLQKQEASLRALRAIKAAILLAKTSEVAKDHLSAEDEIKILQKLVKQRKESLAIYEQQNRPDLAQKEKEELFVIEQFLPNQLSNSEIENEVKNIIEKIEAKTISDLGKVMCLATKELAGKADGKKISELAKKLLS